MATHCSIPFLLPSLHVAQVRQPGNHPLRCVKHMHSPSSCRATECPALGVPGPTTSQPHTCMTPPSITHPQEQHNPPC